MPFSNLESLCPHPYISVLFLLSSCIAVYIFYPALVLRKYSYEKNGNKLVEGIITEKIFQDQTLTTTSTKVNLDNDTRHYLSLVIPAYNEEERLPDMIKSTLKQINQHKDKWVGLLKNLIFPENVEQEINIPFEIQIINDGSVDGTISAVQSTLHEIKISEPRLLWHTSIQVSSLPQNMGKGEAVRTGILSSSSHFTLMLDADNATDLSTGLTSLLLALIEKKKNSPKTELVAFGSRAHLQQESQVKRSLTRTILMHGFHLCVSTFCTSKVQDTQCGFKLFPKGVSQFVFQNLHLKRWAFDIEVIILLQCHGCVEIVEVPVKWQEVEGSKLATGKLALLLASLGMLRDMICVRACYLLGIWRLEAPRKNANQMIKKLK